ncbi:hypothetical protein B0T26DRAFT_706410 [Lasiosphaeria miniovina]|uniref:Uncharacterized protein n=1 Tax=Lasiosphaeria miniovina TaxID=1954250 RepID=A0AA40AWR4_9PEZI|nr:uncharacterized protein B0T26DRAFT_706410 [Lasiosphaeria miniovina]KAK0723431.1 hypothetical protein B0T26DRAFT_706410 [Lasiosphaeria miniovina]
MAVPMNTTSMAANVAVAAIISALVAELKYQLKIAAVFGCRGRSAAVVGDAFYPELLFELDNLGLERKETEDVEVFEPAEYGNVLLLAHKGRQSRIATLRMGHSLGRQRARYRAQTPQHFWGCRCGD